MGQYVLVNWPARERDLLLRFLTRHLNVSSRRSSCALGEGTMAKGPLGSSWQGQREAEELIFTFVKTRGFQDGQVEMGELQLRSSRARLRCAEQLSAGRAALGL